MKHMMSYSAFYARVNLGHGFRFLGREESLHKDIYVYTHIYVYIYI